MKDIFKKVVKGAMIVFFILFIFLFVARLFKINISLRNQKVLELILFISLGIFLIGLIYKSFSGYKKMIKNKDVDMIKELLKIIILVAVVYTVLNLIFTRGKLLKMNSIYKTIRLIIFIIVTLGISYDELVKR